MFVIGGCAAKSVGTVDMSQGYIKIYSGTMTSVRVHMAELEHDGAWKTVSTKEMCSQDLDRLMFKVQTSEGGMADIQVVYEPKEPLRILVTGDSKSMEYVTRKLGVKMAKEPSLGI